MTNSICCPEDYFGAKPINIKWNVIRGDTAKLKIEFAENDEVTAFDTTGWDYASSAYDERGDVLDELEVDAGPGYVYITAPADITANWGSGYGSVIAELGFDLQVTIDDVVWTPVLGTISVMADITGGL